MTRAEAIAQGHQGAVLIDAFLTEMEAEAAGNPTRLAGLHSIRHRLHALAAKAEELEGLPYGTLLAGGGGPKSPPPPPPGP